MDKPPSGRSLGLAAILLLAFTVPGIAQDANRKSFRWGTDPTGGAPFIYADNDGKFIGFEVDFADYLSKWLNRKSEFVKGDWDKLPQLLDQPVTDDEGIDAVLNGYEFSADLSKQYAPSRPYYVYRIQLLAHKDDDTIEDWVDLVARNGKPGKSVGVLGGTAAHAYLNARFEKRIDLKINPDVATVIGLVKDKRLDATVQDSPAARYFLREIPQLKSIGEAVKPGFYVLYVRKNDAKLLAAIDDAIRDGVRDGTLKAIYDKYGLWNEDQERLAYWASKPWPPVEADAVISDAKDDKNVERKSPLPRLAWELAEAALMTIKLSVLSFPLAMSIGLLVAIGRVFGPRWLGTPLGIYVEVVRGTPLLLQLYSMFYLLPPALAWLDMHGVWLPITSLSPLQAGVLGLALNYSAYEAENYRAGLLAIPRGQMEAALSLGMTPLTAIRRVIVPQAARLVIPPVTNDFIALFKDTSVCSAILITELTRKYNELYNFNRDYIVELVFITGGLYLLMSYPLALAARSLETRLSVQKTGGKP